MVKVKEVDVQKIDSFIAVLYSLQPIPFQIAFYKILSGSTFSVRELISVLIINIHNSWTKSESIKQFSIL